MIFIDTGPFLARYRVQDQYHQESIIGWEKINASREHCYTSNFVLDEFFTLLARWSGYPFAAERARTILTSPTFTILRPTHNDELEAVELFSKYADHEVSFTDCISFVLIRSHKIRQVYSFDHHFERIGVSLFR